MNTFPREAYIEAEIELLSPEAGGRRSPIASGYRCNCWIGKSVDGQRVYNDATFYFFDPQGLQPGSRGRARVRPHLPDDWAELGEGSSFDLCEGRRAVGTAKVTSVDPAK